MNNTTADFWWGTSPTPPPLPGIPVARFKVGDTVPSSGLRPMMVLGARLILSPHQDYPTGWDETPVWEYNLWWWKHNKRFDTYSYEEWGWVKEDAVLKVWNEFQEKQVA